MHDPGISLPARPTTITPSFIQSTTSDEETPGNTSYDNSSQTSDDDEPKMMPPKKAKLATATPFEGSYSSKVQSMMQKMGYQGQGGWERRARASSRPSRRPSRRAAVAWACS